MAAITAKLERTDEDIHSAVVLWVDDPSLAEARYGHISRWNTSSVTDMSFLFSKDIEEDGVDEDDEDGDDEDFFADFDEDISAWDVSSVTDMSAMFYRAVSFNGNISAWDVSAVTTMFCMFEEAQSFDCDISNWTLASLTDMFGIFMGAESFNCGGGNIGLWNTALVENMGYTFNNASSFDQDISHWNIYAVTNMQGAFCECPVDFTDIWEERQRVQHKKDNNWARRRAWIMVISPFLRQEGATESPIQKLFDVQGLFQLITSFL